MPDAEGKLTQNEKETVRAWLVRWKIRPCPVCGNQNWTIGDHLVQPVTLGAGQSLMLGGLGYPQVMVISNECGYTHLLNAVIVGVVKPNPSGGE